MSETRAFALERPGNVEAIKYRATDSDVLAGVTSTLRVQSRVRVVAARIETTWSASRGRDRSIPVKRRGRKIDGTCVTD
jgi:hypothetical protein